MKSENEIKEQRDLLMEYRKDPTGYRLTPMIFSDKEIDAQIMALNWVLEESKHHAESVIKRE